MRVTHDGFCPVSARIAKQTLEKLALKGRAVEVTKSMNNGHSGHRVFIDANTYERFVEWDAQAMRRHLISIEPMNRLEQMLDAAAYVAISGATSGSFVCRAIDAQGDGVARRMVFRMENLGTVEKPKWLIRH